MLAQRRQRLMYLLKQTTYTFSPLTLSGCISPFTTHVTGLHNKYDIYYIVALSYSIRYCFQKCLFLLPIWVCIVEDKVADEDDHDVAHGSASSLFHPESQKKCGSSCHGDQQVEGAQQKKCFPTKLPYSVVYKTILYTLILLLIAQT